MSTPTASVRAARVAASRRPDHGEPWLPAVAGTHYYLLLSELEAAALSHGIVLLRTQRQARLLLRYLDDTEAT